MNIDKILEKIYSEKDISTNISTFVGSILALIVYYFFNDPYLSLISFVGIFSICKVISNIFITKISKSKEKEKNLKSYSKAEKEAINIFISNGTSSLMFNDINLDKKTLNGFRSLKARNKAELIYTPGVDPDAGPIGITLSENIFDLFLEE